MVETKKTSRVVAMMLAIMLIFLATPIPIVNATTGGTNIGTGPGSTGTGYTGSQISHDYQGLRVYLLDQSGNLVTSVIDILCQPVTQNIDWQGVSTKDGQGGEIVTAKLTYNEHFPNMPKPWIASGSNYKPQGDLIKAYLDAPTDTGVSYIQYWLDEFNIFSLEEGDKKTTDVMLEKGYSFFCEPVMWITVHNTPGSGQLANSTYHGWFYGTPTDWAYEHADGFGLDNFVQDSVSWSITREMWAASLTLIRDVDLGKVQYSAFNGKYPSNGSYWSINEILDTSSGHAIGEFRLEGGGTSTWDDPVDVPEKPPAEEGDGTITIVKNYVSGENPETHVTTVYRDNTLRDILVENEPDVGYDLIAYLLHI